MFAAHLVGQSFLITLNDASYSDSADSPDNAFVRVRLDNDGTLKVSTFSTGSVFTTQYAWVAPSHGAALYECRATNLSGTFASGTFDTWEALSSDRTWLLQRTTLGISTGSILLEIRDVATSTVRDSATINFSATRTS